MKRASLYLLAGLLTMGATLGACSKDNKFIGSWTASAPVSIAADIPAATTANAIMSIDFMSGPDAGASGNFYMSWLVDCNQAVTAADSVIQATDPYEVSVAATAAVGGTWTRHDDDELLLSFDMSTFKVEVDPDGVTYSQNVLNGAEQPAIDSLTTRTSAIWERQLATCFKSTLQRYSRLDDVEVASDGGMLKFEVKDAAGNDRDVVMRRVINAD